MTPEEEAQHLAAWPTGTVQHMNLKHHGRVLQVRYTHLGDRWLTEVCQNDGCWRELTTKTGEDIRSEDWLLDSKREDDESND